MLAYSDSPLGLPMTILVVSYFGFEGMTIAPVLLYCLTLLFMFPMHW